MLLTALMLVIMIGFYLFFGVLISFSERVITTSKTTDSSHSLPALPDRQ
jgi:hypothetical protein